MDSTGFADCCNEFLVPFIQRYYPVHHSVYLDNAGYHTKSYEYIQQNGINKAETPAQSPNMNPIELVWNDLKYYLKNKIKPRNLEELCAGIHRFWSTKVTVEYCNSKISYFRYDLIYLKFELILNRFLINFKFIDFFSIDRIIKN